MEPLSEPGHKETQLSGDFTVEMIVPQLPKSASSDARLMAEQEDKKFKKMTATLKFRRTRHATQTRSFQNRELQNTLHGKQDPDPRKIRVRKNQFGALSTLFDLPFDVIVEIATSLHPLDILRLSYASKELRIMFNPHKHPQVWTASLRGLPIPPPICPSDINHAQYVNLLFLHPCVGCEVSRAKMIDYAIRHSFCKKCYTELMKKGSLIVKQMRLSVPDVLFTLIPRGIYSRRDQLETNENIPDAMYYIADVYSIVEKYRVLQHHPELLQKFIKQQQGRSRDMVRTGLEIQEWVLECSAAKSQSTEDIMNTREHEMKQRLLALGHTEDDFDFGPYFGLADNFNTITRAPRPFTENIWRQSLPRLLDILATHQEERFLAILRPRLALRRTEFWAIWEPLIPEHFTEAERKFLPSKNQTLDFDCVMLLLLGEDQAQTPVTEERFSPIMEELTTQIQRFIAGLKTYLIRTLDRKGQDWDLDFDCEWGEVDQFKTALNNPMSASQLLIEEPRLYQADALFTCGQLLSRGIAWASIFGVIRNCNKLMTVEELIHHRNTSHATSLWEGCAAKCNPLVVEQIKAILKGLDLPEDTKLFDLVQLGNRFQCQCGHPSMQGKGTSFKKLLEHMQKEVADYSEIQRSNQFLLWPSNISYELINDHHLDKISSLVKLTSEDIDLLSGTGEQDGGGTSTDAVLPPLYQRKCCVACFELSARLRSGIKRFSNNEEAEYHLRTKHGLPFAEEHLTTNPYLLPRR